MTSSAPHVAIAGATGAVGGVLLEILAERAFPMRSLRLLASARSAGQEVDFAGRRLVVEELREEILPEIDLLFFAATGALSKAWAPKAVAAGVIVIDKSSTWRMDPEVPLVVPEVNGSALVHGPKLIACPNCSTIGVVQAVAPIHAAAGVRHMTVTTLQAVSGAGVAGIEEMRAQQEDPGRVPQVFAAPIAGNAVPWCGDAVTGPEGIGSTEEERKLQLESRRILDHSGLTVDSTCVRVPVEVGHSASIRLDLERALTLEEARAAIRAWPGVELVDDPSAARFPTPQDVVGRDAILVGRVRVVDGPQPGLLLWQVGDNLRKGAATNAVQIAERLYS